VKRLYIYLVIGLLVASSAVYAADPTAYVINTSGETLSKINLLSGAVTNDILPLGSDINCYPNQILIRDTMAYVLMSGTAEIQMINLNTETTSGWITFADPAASPYWMDFLDDRYLYVTLMVDNSLAKIDVITGQVVETVAVGKSPEGVVIYDNKAFIAITAYDFGAWTWGQGQVAVYDTDIDTVVAEIEVGKNPQYIACDRRGVIHVTCTGNYYDIPGMIYRIDAADFSIIDSLAVGGQPGQIAIGPDDMACVAAGGWAADGEVFIYDAESGEIRNGAGNPVYVDSGATGASTFQDATALICTFGDRINRIDGAGNIIYTYNMGDGPIHVAFDYRPGDGNGDWDANVGDAVYLVNYIFESGSAPVWPLWRANANGDGMINVGDAVYLINYIFNSGPRPQVGPTWIQ